LGSKVYPLYSGDSLYAALQEGSHAFAENGKVGGYARFSHLWKKENGTWKLARSYSYAHGPIADHFTALMQEHRVPILGLAVVDKQAFSTVLLPSGTENKRFNVASLSKPVTALITLKLVDQGLLDLDEPVYRYWTDPDIKGDQRARLLTLRHLLSHQSGFPNWRQGKLRFGFTPGTAYGYSGEGMEYVRKVIEKKTGKKWEALAKDLLFHPLQMNDTGWKVDRAVPAYREDGSRYPALKAVKVNAADDLYTTVEDYAHFLTYLLQGAGLSEELYAAFLAPQVKTKRAKFFALGMEGYEVAPGRVIYAHGGSDEGVRCIFFLDPLRGEGILVLSSSDNGHNLYADLLKVLGSEYANQIIAIEESNEK
jgi:CubicO group peptidase (beta-lactamase class C family)